MTVAMQHQYYNSQHYFVLNFVHNMTVSIAITFIYCIFWSYPQAKTNGASFV